LSVSTNSFDFADFDGDVVVAVADDDDVLVFFAADADELAAMSPPFA
jgi:hypothetical protein